MQMMENSDVANLLLNMWKWELKYTMPLSPLTGGGPPLDGMPYRSMETELTGATQKLGIKSDNLIMYEYPIRRMSEQGKAGFIPRLSIIDIMVNLGEKWVECLNKQEGKGE